MIYISLLVLDVIKFNKVFIIPFLFEIFILVFAYLKYKNKKKLKPSIIMIIKSIVLLITIMIGIVGINSFINQTLLKSLLSITVLLQVLSFLDIIGFKCKKVKRV